MKRQAVDSAASEYWTKYFKDSGYGALWVRKMPMRLRAALRREGALPGPLEPDLTLLAHAVEKDGVTVEGVARSYLPGADGQPQRVARLFQASFDHAGQLTSFASLPSP